MVTDKNTNVRKRMKDTGNRKLFSPYYFYLKIYFYLRFLILNYFLMI